MDLAGRGIQGICNVGNTCYINASIQCMGHCMHFLKYVLLAPWRSGSGNGSNGNISEVTLIDELRMVLHALWIEDHGIIPHRFMGYLVRHMKSIDVREQNDMQEFITLFIDKLNQCVAVKLDVPRTLAETPYTDTAIDRMRRKVDASWYRYMGHEYSPLVDIFYGQSVVQIVCGNCKKLQQNHEPFSVFLVPIPTHPCELVQCLHHHVAEEFLNDDAETNGNNNTNNDAWKCDACDKTAKSLKIMKFWRLPKVLTICLKRFMNNSNKNCVPVRIPEKLDMTSYVIGPVPTMTYTLKSVGCHVGNFNNGHYFAMCKNPDEYWYVIDDAMTHKLEKEFRCPDTAYMAFYEME